jgi:DNA-binding CsgD family transcriptional regulator
VERDEARSKLQKLTARQREVLSLFCQGKPYKDISEDLFVKEKTVRAHMWEIRSKLGLDSLENPAERRKVLFEVFCPLLKEDLPPPPDEAEALPPLTPDQDRAVDEDNNALVVVEPTRIGPPPFEERRNRAFIWIAVFVLVGVVLGIGGTFFVMNLRQGESTATLALSPTENQGLALLATGVDPPTETLAPVPTVTVAPSSTPQPTATLMSLPFSDNFENGPRSEWQFFGNWLVTDGRLTVIYDPEGEYQTAVLPIAGWTNYRVKVDIYIPHQFSANTGETAIFVRLDSVNSKYIGFYSDYFGDAGWAYYPSNRTDPEYLGTGKSDFPQSAKIELVVTGNQYTAYLGGTQATQVTIMGYDTGALILAVQCKGVGSCPTFDNFAIEPIG